MDILGKIAVKNSASNYQTVDTVRMHDLENSEENSSENSSETSSLMKEDVIHFEDSGLARDRTDSGFEDKTKIPMRRTESELSRRSGDEHGILSKSSLENHLSLSDSPKLSRNDETDQVLRRRPADKMIMSDNDGKLRVSVASEASVVDVSDGVRITKPFPSSGAKVETAEEIKEKPHATLVNPSEKAAALAKATPTKAWCMLDYWRQICGTLLFAISFLAAFPTFLCGILWGAYLTTLIFQFFSWFYNPLAVEVDHVWPEKAVRTNVTEKELMKVDKVIYKGWMNLLKDNYDPTKYNVSSTKSVLVRLDGDILRLSIPKTNMPRHAFWNETKVDETFISQEMYNIVGATISLRPKNLAARRWWSNKYPIRIAFAQGVVVGVPDNSQSDTALVVSQQQPILDDESDLNSDNDSELSVATSVSGLSLPTEMETKLSGKNRKTIYLFSRSTREKEQWFHQLRKAAGQYSFKLTHDERGIISESEMNAFDLQKQSLDWILYTSVQKQFQLNMDLILLSQVKEPRDVMRMELDGHMWKPADRVTSEMAVHQDNITWANALATRIFLDASKDPFWVQKIKTRIDRKMGSIHLPYFIESLKVVNLETGANTPRITGVYEPTVNEWGLWVDVNIEYSGGIHLQIETKLNLSKLKKDVAIPAKREANEITNYSDPAVPESPEISDGEENDNKAKEPEKEQEKPKKGTGQKVLDFMDKVTQSKPFQKAIETKVAKKIMKGVHDTPLILMVDVVYLEGTLAINLPTPPSDRFWYSFRCPPKIVLKAKPKVGERSVNLSHVTDWIENKLCYLLEKFLVIPNMDDFIIPLMSGNPLLKDVFD